jgi:hypothetical protein
VLRDADPVVRALFADELEEELIFFGDPRATAVGGSHGGGEKGGVERSIQSILRTRRLERRSM